MHKTFRRCLGRLLHVLCTFNLRPVSRAKCFVTKNIKTNDSHSCQFMYVLMMLLEICAYMNRLGFICSLQSTFYANRFTLYNFFGLETNTSCLLFYLHFAMGLFQKITINLKFIKSLWLKWRIKMCHKIKTMSYWENAVEDPTNSTISHGFHKEWPQTTAT